jgi:primosomal protein N' (replication factor Y)
MYYYEIAPLKIIRQTSNTFTYCSPQQLGLGDFVTIPIGKTSQLGIVVQQTAKPHYETKQVQVLTTPIPPLPAPLILTALWMAEYYATHLATVLQTVLPSGLQKNRRKLAFDQATVARNRTHYLLNEHQTSAVETITTMGSGTAILHGVTGSGKTAIYIELVRRSIQQNKSAIILVPEIALTSQLVGEFSQHFPDLIVAHSKQSEAERHSVWLKASTSNNPHIIIGPRSALFMPLTSIGVIIIDEAHEPSFKQDQAPRYSALRVASILARHHHAKVVQGSATPTVAEYYTAKQADRPIITISEKAQADTVAPMVTIIDMTKRGNFLTHRFLSDNLITSIRNNIDHGNQSLIFHNRRGTASTTLCESCGWSATCPQCFIPFTLHADSHSLICHICGTKERVPTNCPVCMGTDIVHKGIGTKLIESELRRLFPNVAIARFDGDTEQKDTVEQRYQELYDGDISIIIGTQVIAKGLDLPKLRTVGVIQADAGLSLPDFTSSERTFQLLAQVVGRVGRSHHATEVIVQSYQPTAPAVQLGIAQNYVSFYEQAIIDRQHGQFPPFTFLLKLTCIYKTEAAAIKNAKALAVSIRSSYPGVTLFGPTPAFYERQHDTYRWQVIVKSKKRATLLAIAATVPSQHWHVDIDPASLL